MKTFLSPKQSKAVESLLRGDTVERAAVAAGVTSRTVQKWLNEPGFFEAVRDGQTIIIKQISTRLTGLANIACDTLEAVMLEERPPHGSGMRVRAADIVIGALLRYVELVELEARITRLERIHEQSRT